MIKLHLITTSRSDFSIWSPIIQMLNNDQEIQLKVIVTGLHYAEELGATFREVKQNISSEILVELPITHSINDYSFIGEMFINYNQYINCVEVPDMILLLGDRYELLPILNVAVLNRVTIAHFYPAECDVSYCIDTQVRDAITKSAHLFFVTHDDYAKRLEVMGEEKWRIAVVGNSNVAEGSRQSSSKIEAFLKDNGVDLDSNKLIVNCCYHPPTINKGLWKSELPALLEALKTYQDQFIMIWSGINSDPDSFEMKQYLLHEVSKYNMLYFDSLGGVLYRSLLSSAAFTIGNSSSGLYEAPMFGCPTINVGVRQSGRLHGESVLDVKANTTEITEAIERVLAEEFDYKNVYYNESFPDNITLHIKKYINNKNIKLKKLYIKNSYSLRRVPEYQ